MLSSEQRLQQQQGPQNPSDLKLEDVVEQATFAIGTKSNVLRDEIPKRFNAGVSSVISQSWYRGKRIKPDEFWIVQCNGIVELVSGTQNYLALPLIYGFNDITEVATPKQNALFYGSNGKYVVNVPAGKYCKAWYGTRPILLEAGTHIINDVNFKLDIQTANQIQQNFIDQASPLIQHGTISILRIPGGKVATVWLGSKPEIWDSRDQPYVSKNQFFKLERKSQEELFWDANAQLIVHGSYKRVMPQTAQAVATYDNGRLKILFPKEEPHIITSATHLVKEPFINTGIVNMLLPTEENKAKRRIQDSGSPLEANYIVTTTKDLLKIGIEIFLTYQIIDVEKALTLLDINGISAHIENLTTSSIGSVMQQTSQAEILRSPNFNTTHVMPAEHKDEEDSTVEVSSVSESTSSQKSAAEMPSAPPAYATVLHDALDTLTRNLGDVGIKVVRFNIEKFRVLNEKIATELSEQAVNSAKILGQTALVNQQADINRGEAERTAESSRIAQAQANQNIISEAQARAQAIAIETTARKNAEQEMAQLYAANPVALAFAQLQLQAKALQGAKIIIAGSEVPLSSQSPASFFYPTSMRAMALQSLVQEGDANNNTLTSTTPGMTPASSS